MSREAVRAMKKGIRGAPGSLPSTECAIALLERSIAFGHRRLAVIRLSMAASIGASLSQEHWNYCFRVASESKDDLLLELCKRAAPSCVAAPTHRPT